MNSTYSTKEFVFIELSSDTKGSVKGVNPVNSNSFVPVRVVYAPQCKPFDSLLHVEKRAGGEENRLVVRILILVSSGRKSKK